MSSNSAAKNPVKSAFRLVQRVWEKPVTVTAYSVKDQPCQFTFEYLEVIGNGTFGIVCRARDLATNEIVAIKTVYQDEGHQNRELGIIKSLDHPNIVRLHRYFYTRNEFNEEFLSLVLEYMPTSLDRILKDYESHRQKMPSPVIRMCMYQFLKALEYLHKIGICHRDVKPHNLLVDLTSQRVKLCDFGCSKKLIEGEPNIQYICARYYRAPEIVFGWSHYTCAIDMWSAGCVMAEMFTGRPLFPGKNSIDQLTKIVRVIGSPTPEDLVAMGQPVRGNPSIKSLSSSSPSAIPAANTNELHSKVSVLSEVFEGRTFDHEALDLLLGLLTYDPKKRLVAPKALSGQFFAEYMANLDTTNSSNSAIPNVNTATDGSSEMNGNSEMAVEIQLKANGNTTAAVLQPS